MKSLWKRLFEDETGVVLSAEIALVGTVGVLGMVVGLEAVTSAVNNELNDFASAIGAIDQSYNYRSIAKPSHAWVRGSGYNDRGDFCDCVPLVATDVGGKSGVCGASEDSFSQSAVVSTAPVVREQIVQERVIDEVIVEPAPVVACPEDEIIEEHIIRRRVRADCDKSHKVVPHTKIAPLVIEQKILPAPKLEVVPPNSKSGPTKPETKPKKNG